MKDRFMMRAAHITQVLAVLFSICLCGCSDGSVGGASRKPVFKVTGSIKMSGGPVAGAFVSFSPQEGQPVATATTDDAGNFTMTTYSGGDGAAAGSFKVLVTKSTAPASKPLVGHDPTGKSAGSGAPMHDAKATAAASSALPEKYSRADATDLIVSVKSDGENKFDLELKP